MTIDVETPFSFGIGNGVTRVWPYSFTLFDEADLQVILIDNVTGATLSTVPPGEYTVTINEDTPGGSVEYPLSPVDPLASTHRIGMIRQVPYDQESDINNQGGFHPNVIEHQMDLIVMMVQQLAESDGRSLKVDPGMEPVSIAELIASTSQAIAAADEAEAAAAVATQAAMNAESAADEAATSLNKSIRFDVAQSLSPSEQAQALTNIGMDPLITLINGAQQQSAKGQPNGYAPLGPDSLIPGIYLPTGGGYIDTWNANTNTPTITSGVGSNGDYYVVSVAGTTTIDGISSWSVGDTVKFNGTAWTKIPSFSAVSSVAGKTGAVTLVKADVGLGNVDNTSDANKPISTATQTALDLKVPTSRTVTASTGLTGGGSLAGNIALALSSTSIASLALADAALQPGEFGVGSTGAMPLLANLDATNTAAGTFIVNNTTTGTWPDDWPTNASATVEVQRGTGNYISQKLLAYGNNAVYANTPLYRSYNDATNTWAPWSINITAQNLRSPPLTVPLAHFERSIPLNFWELGIRGHDTNPTVDEGALITTAITRAITEKRKLVIPATLYLSSGTTITTDYELEMEGIGGMPFILPTNSLITGSGGVLRFLPGVANADWLAYGTLAGADRGVGGRSVTLPSSWNGTVGDCYVGLTSDKLWYWDARSQWYKGEFHRVVRTGGGGTQLYFEDNTHDSYDSTETVNYRVWKANRLDLHNIGFGNKSWTTPNGGLGDTYDPSAIEVRRTRNMNLDKIETYGFGGTHIVQRACEGTIANDIYMWGGGYTTEDDGGGGYGMSHLCCKNARYTNIRGGGMRRLIDFSGVSGTTVSFGPSRNCDVNGFHAWGGGRQSSGVDFKPHGSENSFGVGTHGPADGITWRNGIIENVGQGLTVRGQNIIIDNVEFKGRITENCIGLSYAQGVTIKNCKYNSGFYGKTDEQGVAANQDLVCPIFIQFGNETGSGQVAFDLPIVIEGNNFDGLSTAFIYFGGAQGNDLQDARIVGNNGRAGNLSTDTFYMFKSNTGQIQARGCEIYDNDAVPASGNNGPIQHDDGFLIIGGKASDSRAIDRPSKVGPNTWRFWLSDDAALRTNFAFVSATSHSQFSTTQRRKIIVTPLSDNQNAAFDGWIKMSSATPIVIHQGSLVEVRANASALTGTGGTDGKLNIGLADDGTFAIENRTASAIAVDVTIL